MYRGTLKTYLRPHSHGANEHGCENPNKRICLDSSALTGQDSKNLDCHPLEPQQELLDQDSLPPSSSTVPSSSPGRNHQALFSSDPPDDEDSELSSLPSSPPDTLTSISQAARKPAFAFLKRKRPVNEDDYGSLPLSEITTNVQKVPAQRAIKKAKIQMQIDLGGALRRRCRSCGMEYIPSVKEDSILHKAYCDSNVEGVDMGKVFVKDKSLKKLSCQGPHIERVQLVLVDSRGSTVSRLKAKHILDVVNTELSATEISYESLWEPLRPVQSIQTREKNKEEFQQSRDREDRYKVILCLLGDRCIGFCLAEKIRKAFPVLEKQSHPDSKCSTSASSSITVSKTADLALLGISRIWVSKAFRQSGIARALLGCVQSHFFFGVQIPKELMAFSQPTESGAHLAEKWFEANKGWHVYQGNQ